MSRIKQTIKTVKWLNKIFKDYPELDSSLGVNCLYRAMLHTDSTEIPVIVNCAIELFNEEIQELHKKFKYAVPDAKPPKLLKKLYEFEYEDI